MKKSKLRKSRTVHQNKKLKWSTPKLIVLSKCTNDEFVLSGCKVGGCVPSAPANACATQIPSSSPGS